MTSSDLIASAIANRQKRLAQVAALRPRAKDADQRAQELQAARKGVKETGQRVQFVRSMHYVPGFFPTPPAIVERMIEAAELEGSMRILEPSCGKGNIAHRLTSMGHPVYCVEVVPALAEYCRKDGLAVQCADFLGLTLHDFSFAEGVGGFDRVMMNPPFEKRQDEAHIRHAFEFLRPGGILVAICTVMTAARMSGWVRERHGHVETLPPGAFQNSERPTGVNTSLIVAHRFSAK